MTVREHVKRWAAIALVGMLGACQSAANAGFESHSQVHANTVKIAYGETQKHLSSSMPEALEAKILNQAFEERESLGLCQGSFNFEQSSVGSKLYSTGSNQYLIQLQCFQAAYQGNYAFAVATVDQDQVQLTLSHLLSTPSRQRSSLVQDTDASIANQSECRGMLLNDDQI